jgi:hypothetical protein
VFASLRPVDGVRVEQEFHFLAVSHSSSSNAGLAGS